MREVNVWRALLRRGPLIKAIPVIKPINRYTEKNKDKVRNCLKKVYSPQTIYDKTTKNQALWILSQ